MSINIVPSEAIRFCDLCHKPITSESAYARHVSYCRRNLNRPRRRPKSCRECHSAKVKCSFEAECSRCRSKGLRCVYEGPVASATRTIKIAKHHDNAPDVAAAAAAATIDYGTPIVDHAVANDPAPSTFGSSGSLGVSWPRSVADLSADPVAQHSVRFILESVRGLPLTLTKRETFSWFNHGYWFQPKLPGNVARCSEIAALYVNRSSADDTLWPIIDQENRRLLRDLPTYTLNELVSGMQAQIIYMTMFALDRYSTHGIPEVSLKMLMTFELYCKKSLEIDQCTWVSIGEPDEPGLTWEEWLHKETRRRCAVTWFLLSRFMDLKFGVTCPSITNCRTLPLPSPASLWGARSRSEWVASRRFYSDRSKDSLKTFGDLLDARSSPPDSDRGRQLDRWHATCDKLGLLLTLATTLV
ncbi:hypothetical protein GGR53DRAFT_371436 [Hypoxylon sp. FL1150]|nr:hypothetical protein GGR53DRAFT_371436 [Hypoxylon sp. FL1150]